MMLRKAVVLVHLCGATFLRRRVPVSPANERRPGTAAALLGASLLFGNCVSVCVCPLSSSSSSSSSPAAGCRYTASRADFENRFSGIAVEGLFSQGDGEQMKSLLTEMLALALLKGDGGADDVFETHEHSPSGGREKSCAAKFHALRGVARDRLERCPNSAEELFPSYSYVSYLDAPYPSSTDDGRNSTSSSSSSNPSCAAWVARKEREYVPQLLQSRGSSGPDIFNLQDHPMLRPEQSSFPARGLQGEHGVEGVDGAEEHGVEGAEEHGVEGAAEEMRHDLDLAGLPAGVRQYVTEFCVEAGTFFISFSVVRKVWQVAPRCLGWALAPRQPARLEPGRTGG